MAAYPRRPLIVTSEAPVAAAFSRVSIGATGIPGDPQYWDHANGNWTAPFSTEVHLKPLPKPHVQDQTVNLLTVPYAVLADVESSAHVYVATSDGSVGSKVVDLDNVSLQGFSLGSPFA